MSMVIRASDLIARPVVTLDTATDLGEIKDVVYDQDRSDLIGFALRGRGLLGTPSLGFLPMPNVSAVGRDAVMISSETRILDHHEALEESLSKPRNVLGNEVLTDTGRVIGRVADVIVAIEGSSSDVAGYEVVKDDGTRVFVPLPAAYSVSGSTLVVPALVEHFVGHDLAGFGAAVEGFRAQLNVAQTEVPR